MDILTLAKPLLDKGKAAILPLFIGTSVFVLLPITWLSRIGVVGLWFEHKTWIGLAWIASGAWVAVHEVGTRLEKKKKLADAAEARGGYIREIKSCTHFEQDVLARIVKAGGTLAVLVGLPNDHNAASALSLRGLVDDLGATGDGKRFYRARKDVIDAVLSNGWEDAPFMLQVHPAKEEDAKAQIMKFHKAEWDKAIERARQEAESEKNVARIIGDQLRPTIHRRIREKVAKSHLRQCEISHRRRSTRRAFGCYVHFMARRRRNVVDAVPAVSGFVVYVRVSTDDQAESGLGLAAQRHTTAAYAQLYGIEVVEVIEDDGYSASTLDRPGMRRILEMMEAGTIAGVLVAKLDRLSRSVKDFGELVERHFAEGRVRLVSVGEQIDTGSASGRLVLHVLMAVAAWEREAIGERTSAALRAKRARGEHVGNVAYGWRYDVSTKQVVEDDGEQLILAEILALDAEGMPSTRIAARLNELGRPARGQRWYQQAVHKLLSQHRGAHAA